MAILFDTGSEDLQRTTNLPADNAFTMMCWAYRTSSPDAYQGVLVFEEISGSAPYYYVVYAGITGNGTQLNLTNGNSDIAGSTVGNNTWMHLALVSDGTSTNNVRMYLNGVLDAQHSGQAGLVATRLRIATTRDAEPFTGRIAAIKIYGAALTAAEIATEMWQYEPVRYANLNGFYPLLSSADTGTDYSANGNNWTVGGTPTTAEGPPIPWRLYRPRTIIYGAGLTHRTLTAESGAYTWTGTAASLLWGRKVAANSGSYAWTGTAASLLLGTKVAANSGAYTWTGTAAGLLHAKKVDANAGSYLWSGTAAGLFLGTRIAANSGTYSWTGTAASFPRTYRITANSGAYSWAGSTADLIYSANDPVLSAESGSYLWTGSAATLKLGTKVAANAGSFSWTGSAASLLRGYKVAANAGAYTWTGSATSLELGYELPADPGSYTWTGSSATLTWSGAAAPASTTGVAAWQSTNFR